MQNYIIPIPNENPKIIWNEKVLFVNTNKKIVLDHIEANLINYLTQDDITNEITYHDDLNPNLFFSTEKNLELEIYSTLKNIDQYLNYENDIVYLDPPFEFITICKRDVMIMYLLNLDKNYKEIAQYLNLSWLNIRDNVDILRHKFNCKNKKTFINLLNEYNILENLIPLKL